MPKTGIYKYEQGRKVELSASQVKTEIMRIHGWDTKEYQREYDILRNKLRAYEAFQRSAGVQVTPQSPQQFLYSEAKAQERYGANYRPSARTALVRATTSVSSGKALSKAVTSTISRKAQQNKVSGSIQHYFGAFIEQVPQAREIMEKIKDPIKQEAALKALAAKLHAREDAQRRTIAQNADMPFGQVSGSSDTIEFDLSPWL